MELHPGPPLNQATKGAVLGFERASKSQYHMFMFVPTERYPDS